MKLTTIALAIAFTLPATFALAEGPMNLGDQVTCPVRGAAVAFPMTTRSRKFSRETLAPFMRDPSGSTLTRSAVNRGG
jgi:hypothetical protein